MAEVMSDYSSPEASRYSHSRTMVAGPESGAGSQYRSRSRAEAPPSPRAPPTSVPAGTPPQSIVTKATARDPTQDASRRSSVPSAVPPSPPGSSNRNPSSYRDESSFAESDDTLTGDGAADSKVGETLSGTGNISRAPRSPEDEQKYGGNTIRVRDLAHIQSFATEDFLSYRGQSGRRRTADDPTLKYEISGMPITDIIEMVAGLLTKITTTNDRQHESLHRPVPSGDTVNMSALSSSVLAFHGKNVPSITILSYLSRIHKYCPTTYEVFLSLLVYFDRMTERVNAMPMQALKTDADQENARPSSEYSAEGSDLADSPSSNRSGPEILSQPEKAQYTHAPLPDQSLGELPLSHFFVVDSFNIHRLVIAGVTCASKFFSDVFYTNSRYAKVGFPMSSQCPRF